MLNICIVFVQLEREKIQKRVTDAYYSRSQRGFKMGGKAPYGFHTEPIKMDGINTKRLVVDLMITTVAATSDSLNITWTV